MRRIEEDQVAIEIRRRGQLGWHRDLGLGLLSLGLCVTGKSNRRRTRQCGEQDGGELARCDQRILGKDISAYNVK